MTVYTNENGIEYNSFIYLWIDKLCNKYYIGSHIGNVNDGYLFGGIDIKKAYKKRPMDFERIILSYHDVESNFEIRDLEKSYLMKYDVENNQQFYNRTNESYGGYHKKSVEKRLNDIDEDGLNSFQKAAKKMVVTRKLNDNYKTAKIKEHSTKKEKMVEISNKISKTLKGSVWVNKSGEKKYIKPNEINLYLMDGWKFGFTEFTLDDCKNFVESNKITTCEDWYKFAKENSLPIYIEKTFKKEWVSWPHFLGKKSSKNHTYQDCKDFINLYNIKTQKEWYRYASEMKLPYHPDRKFKKEWCGWKMFLEK